MKEKRKNRHIASLKLDIVLWAAIGVGTIVLALFTMRKDSAGVFTHVSNTPFTQKTVSKDLKDAGKSVQATVPAHPPYEVGMSLGNTLPWMTKADINAELDDIASVGVTWLRIDMDWDDVQYKNRDTYDWSVYDKVIIAAAAHHFKILPVLGYTPAWARPAHCDTNNCAPADPQAFATFAGAAAARYAAFGVSTWEIWNEPNSTLFWKPAPNPQQYADLLRAAATAIKKQNSSAVVISGGLSPAETKDNKIAPIDFLRALYQDGAGRYFDAVGFHPYSFPLLPSTYARYNAWSQMNETSPSLRSVMIANGDTDKKIWLTEYGAPTGGPGSVAWVGDTDLTSDIDHVTDDLQAQIVIDGIQDVASHPWTGPIFIYSYRDLGTDTKTKENFFGIVRFDGSKKKIYFRLKNILQPQSL